MLLASGARCSLTLADSFPAVWRHGRRYRGLGRLLQRPEVDFVANHHLNGARQVVDVLGVSASKVIAWDWPLDLLDLADSSARTLPQQEPMRLCFAGSISAAKGVWDLVEAVAQLRGRGVDATLEVAGSGDTERLNALVQKCRLSGSVRHLGRVGGDEVIAMLQRATFACVPSRHAYPEGLPLTLYEAMAAGTPIIASDHPMFSGVIEDGETGFVFRAGSSKGIVAAALRGWADPPLYESVSFAAARQYREIGLTTLWGDVVGAWVRDRPDDRAFLRRAPLSST
ncbi:MAG: glycosyltransferase [Ornithinimicrobium sp.]